MIIQARKKEIMTAKIESNFGREIMKKIICPVCDTEYEILETKNECDECGHFWIVTPKEIEEIKD